MTQTTKRYHGTVYYLFMNLCIQQIFRVHSVHQEKAMAPYSSTLAWKISWTEEPGRLQSMGSLRIGQDFTFTFTFMHWRKKWQPTLVFLPGESQGRGSLVGCHLWGRTESDTTEVTQHRHLLSVGAVSEARVNLV